MERGRRFSKFSRQKKEVTPRIQITPRQVTKERAETRTYTQEPSRNSGISAHQEWGYVESFACEEAVGEELFLSLGYFSGPSEGLLVAIEAC